MSRVRPVLVSAFAGLFVAQAVLPTPLRAEAEAQSRTTIEDTNLPAEPKQSGPPVAAADAQRFPARTAIRAIIEQETAKTMLPPDIAEAVVFVESRYDSTAVGLVGEIGLMQVRPETAAMLGFKGTSAELATPETNIHYGVMYLSRAWRLAQGDLCRTLMKYRAGHGEETMSARSSLYCNRARNRLAVMGSAFADKTMLATIPPVETPAAETSSRTAAAPGQPKNIYASLKRGTPAASQAFWAAHEARIRTINAELESKWRRSASR